MSKEIDELADEQKKRLSLFEPNKPFIIRADEIKGFEEYGAEKFVFKRPNVGDRLKIGIREVKYRENLELGGGYDSLAHVLATFAIVCTEMPEGFNFEKVYDFDPLFALYDRFNEWLSFFRLSVQLRQEISSGAGK